jgi:TetR/AcrR family transcriptional regulator, transcriptional repressor for nem operon
VATRALAQTPTSILDVAERLVQQRGYNGFSYADIAGELGVTKAALHYHFRGKAELGEALMTRYAQRFSEALAAIDASTPLAPAKLSAYAALYGDVLRDRRMCLCGMLAAEYEGLPSAIQEVVLRFFEANESWLAQVLERGRLDGSLVLDQSAADTARLIVSSLEGAMLVARPFADLERFETTARALLESLAPR